MNYHFETPHHKKSIFLGTIIIGLFIGGFSLWAFFAPIESGAVATGAITVSGYRRTIQHLEGGIIKQIFVREGSKVKQGQILIKLDDTRAEIALQVARNETYNLLATKARLEAERDDKNSIIFPSILLDTKNDPGISEITQNQEQIFKINQASFDEEINILKQRISLLEEQIAGTNSQMIAVNTQIKYTEEEMKAIQTLEAKKYVDKPKLLAILRDDAKLQGAKALLYTQIFAFKEKIGETQLDINSKNKEHLKEILSDFRETQQKLIDALEKEKSAEDIYNRTNIRSPHDGFVVGLKVHTIGGVIKAGDALMDIVPQKEELVVETKIRPEDIDAIHEGSPVKVRFTSLPTSTPPTLNGVVITVPADTSTDSKSDANYYLARILINSKELSHLSAVQKIYPGMPVDVLIITGRLTPWQYFIVPIKNSFARAFHDV